MSCCYSCRRPLPSGGRIGRTETCPSCDADLHCCLNCRFYDRSSSNQCKEPQAERVVDKEKGNFCDFFSIAASAPASGAGSAGRKKNPLDGLFKNKP